MAIITTGHTAVAADANDRTSPLDSNPACMERTTDASSGNCVIKDEGRPRQTYPPRASTGAGSATPASAPAATVKKSVSSSSGK
jgi:hypothetical protein